MCIVRLERGRAATVGPFGYSRVAATSDATLWLATFNGRCWTPKMNASDSTRSMRFLVLTTVFGAIGALPLMGGPGVRAQIPAVKFDVRAAKGVVVSPVYEGWYEVDGTRYALF